MKVYLSVDHSLKNNGISVFEDKKLIHTENIGLYKEGDIRYVEFRDRITNLLFIYSPDVVILEKPAHLRNANILRALVGLYTIALEASLRAGAVVHTVNPKTVKKHITGSGNATKQQVLDSLIDNYKIPKHLVYFPVFYKKKQDVVKEVLYDVPDSVSNAIYIIESEV